jgi:glycosyltransferase involved in cell wall biosynthesis
MSEITGVKLPKVIMMTSYGIEGRYFRDLAKACDLKDDRLHLLSLNGSENPTWVEEFRVKTSTCQSAFFLTRRIRELREIAKFRPDIIQTHLFRASIVGYFYSRIFGAKFVLTRHHIDEHLQSGNYLHVFIDKLLSRLADQIIVFSEAAKRFVVEREVIDSKKITVIHQGFDFSTLERRTFDVSNSFDELGFKEETFNIICVARYSKVKGQNFLLDALSILSKKGFQFRCAFVGPGDPSWIHDKLALHEEIQDYVKILGTKVNIAKYICAADVVIHPSLADSFSQLIIETQALGVPLIATDIAAAREQIQDGITGIIVPARNSEAIASAAARIISDIGFRTSLGNEASRHVRRKFDFMDMYIKWREVLSDLHSLK